MHIVFGVDTSQDYRNVAPLDRRERPSMFLLPSRSQLYESQAGCCELFSVMYSPAESSISRQWGLMKAACMGNVDDLDGSCSF